MLLGARWTASTAVPLAPTPGPGCRNDDPEAPSCMLYGAERMNESMQGRLSAAATCKEGAGQGAEEEKLG